jgi:hypothetical protein
MFSGMCASPFKLLPNPPHPTAYPKNICTQIRIQTVEGTVLSSKPENEWVFRNFNRRLLTVKGKNEQVRKISALDTETNIPFGIDVPKDVSMKSVDLGKTYFASLKIFTARNVQGIEPGYVEFFKVIDVDQSAEDFIRAYWAYPKLIKLELVEVEPAE